MKIGDSKTGELLNTVALSEAFAGALFESGGKHILVWDETGIGRIWDNATGQTRGEPFGSKESRISATSSHDQRRLLICYHGEQGKNAIQVWDRAKLTPLSPPRKLASSIHGAMCSHDDKKLLGLASGAQIRDADTLVPLGPVLEHTRSENGNGPIFSGDDSKVITWSNQYDHQFPSAVFLWETSTGNPISSPLVHFEKILGGTVNRDGSQLATWTDHDFIVWDFSTPLGSPAALSKLQHEVRMGAQLTDQGELVPLSSQ